MQNQKVDIFPGYKRADSIYPITFAVQPLADAHTTRMTTQKAGEKRKEVETKTRIIRDKG